MFNTNDNLGVRRQTLSMEYAKPCFGIEEFTLLHTSGGS